ncbi:hypothetical protein HWV62_36783 [Athelia sp. TMB]|nr:hypothetical protein HWV62_36783 [Athelia sp. TMB]
MILYSLLNRDKKKKAKGEGKANETPKAKSAQPQKTQKTKSVHEIVRAAKTATLTTRSADGTVQSRVMIPATAFEESQTSLIFFGNNASEKFKELPENAHVNISFADVDSTYCASYIGTAKVSVDRGLISQYWSNA